MNYASLYVIISVFAYSLHLILTNTECSFFFFLNQPHLIRNCISVVKFSLPSILRLLLIHFADVYL